MLFSKIVYFLFSIFCLVEQDFESKSSDNQVTIHSCSTSPIEIYSFYGREIELLDSIKIINGKGIIDSKNIKPGFYKLKQDGIEFDDIILHPSESPTIKICDSIQKVAHSSENAILDSLKAEISNKYEMISNLELIDTKDDPVYSMQISAVIDSIKNGIIELTKRAYESNNKSFAALSTYEYSRHILVNDSANYFKDLHYNEELIQSTLYPNLIMNYFKKFVDYNEFGFKNAVDEILYNFSINDRTYHFALEFLIHLFDRVGPKMIYDYLIEKYIIDEACSQEEVISQRMIDSYLKIRLGAKPDNFIINESDFYSICKNNEYTTLLFWSSHCQVCHEYLPLISEVINQSKSQIIAVSLDTDINDTYQKKKSDVSWINVCDFKGWKGVIPELFKISKTPTIYVFNKNAEIVLKDVSYDKYKSFFMP